jgi:hypothetical protein
MLRKVMIQLRADGSARNVTSEFLCISALDAQSALALCIVAKHIKSEQNAPGNDRVELIYHFVE